MPIKFYYDLDDNTLESINTGGLVLTQGQANSVEFHFYFKNYDTLETFTINDMYVKSCLLNIERPDGSASNNILATPVIDDGDYYYKLVITNWVTEHDGVLQITAKLFDTQADTTTTFGLATQNIVASASISDDTIEDQQYQALLEYLNNLPITKYEVIADGAIDELDLVMFTGTVGGSGKITVAKAGVQGSLSIHSSPELVFGIALSSAENNGTLIVLTEGIIRNVDTSGFVEGKILVPDKDNAGQLIEVDDVNAPTAPYNRMPIAVSIYSHQNHGVLIVRPTFFPTMRQIKDVDMSGIQTNNVLAWDGTKFVAKYMAGIYYDDDLPIVEDRFTNMTWFDQSNENIATWILPTVFWQPQVGSSTLIVLNRTLIDTYGAFQKVTKIEILNAGMQVIATNTNEQVINGSSVLWSNNWFSILFNGQLYYTRVTFEYFNQNDIVIADVRLAQFIYFN